MAAALFVDDLNGRNTDLAMTRAIETFAWKYRPASEVVIESHTEPPATVGINMEAGKEYRASQFLNKG